MAEQKYKNSPTTNKNKQAGPIVYTAIPINTRLSATILCSVPIPSNYLLRLLILGNGRLNPLRRKHIIVLGRTTATPITTLLILSLVLVFSF
jgi:hypothetical protein